MTDVTGCPKCNFTGFKHVEGDDTRVTQCICSYAKTLKAYLGTEIAKAPTITHSPLYVLGDRGQTPKVDRTRENLFISSYWSDLLPHLKWTLACKGPMFRFRVVTDEKLKTVYLGNESYKLRAKDVRDGVETFNSIGDLVGPDIDLVILRLGFLGYKNVAMPGVLKEALLLRESADKPTWLVEIPNMPFTYGHFSHSEDVAEYVNRLYDKLTFKSEGRPYEQTIPFDDELGDEVGISAPLPVSRPRPSTPQPPPPSIEIPDLDVVMESQPRYKKAGSFNKKRKGGGGPA